MQLLILWGEEAHGDGLFNETNFFIFLLGKDFVFGCVKIRNGSLVIIGFEGFDSSLNDIEFVFISGLAHGGIYIELIEVKFDDIEFGLIERIGYEPADSKPGFDLEWSLLQRLEPDVRYLAGEFVTACLLIGLRQQQFEQS